MGRRKWIVAGVVGLVLGFVVLGGLMLLARHEPAKTVAALDLPRPGEARAEYLPDGTPVWVIGHRDGSVDVFSALSTHVPAGVFKLTWWCPKSRAVEDPFDGSSWNEYGVKTTGPAPYDLSRWSTAVHGDKVLLGDEKSGPPGRLGTSEAESCHAADDVTLHTFDGWRRWTSPRDAIAARPAGWILLAGVLVSQNDGRVAICSDSGCDDAAILDGIGPMRSKVGAFDDLPADLFIVTVRDGLLKGLTRVIVLNGTPSAS
jgi:hypothetical protein